MTLPTENFPTAETVAPPQPSAPSFAPTPDLNGQNEQMSIAVCPYLGLFDDRGLVLSEPSDAHRCFARSRPIIPSDTHQNSHCLHATHVHCRFYHPTGMIAQANQGYPAQGNAAQNNVAQGYAPQGYATAYGTTEAYTADNQPTTPIPQAFDDGNFAPSAMPRRGQRDNPYALPDLPYAITTPPPMAPVRLAQPRRNWLWPLVTTLGALVLLGIGLWIGQQWGQPAAVATPIATPVLPTIPSLGQLPTTVQAAPLTAGINENQPTLTLQSNPGVQLATPQPTIAQPIDAQSNAAPPLAENQAEPVNAPTNTSLAPAIVLQVETPTLVALATAQPTAAIVSTQTQPNTAIAAGNATLGDDPFDLITPEPNGDVLRIIPRTGGVGWWKSNDQEPNHLNDSFLYVGLEGGDLYLSVIRFDLTRIARGATLQRVALRINGLRADRLSPSASGVWNVEALGDDLPVVLGKATFEQLRSAQAIWSLPQLTHSDLVAGKEYLWELDEATRRWLEQQVLNGVRTLTVRISANLSGDNISNDNSSSALFAWDSGIGPETQRKWPTLLVVAGAPPITPPPLPSQTVIVATLTPTPENVLTVVAQGATATYVAQAVGTYTPLPYALVTPTSLPKNLATLQVLAAQQGLPPVALDTSVPQNEATSTAIADFATAVARTTGTFTPVPANYVTPALIIGSPPAENVATEAARSATATIEATYGYPTPTALPHNAILAEYVYATELPENTATAVVVAALATAEALVEGTPTPLPWNAIIITRVPTPLTTRATQAQAQPRRQPTATPVPTKAAPTATNTTTVTSAPVVAVSGDLRNKILFRRAGANGDETWLFDPITAATSQVSEVARYDQAKQLMAYSPDLSQLVYVSTDASGGYQIFVRRADGATQQLTRFKGASYDPVWSPQGNLIAFVSNESGNDEVYVMDPNGENVRRLTNSDRFDKHPTWSPDGQFLVFYSTRDNRRQLWMMRADGSGQRNLSNNQSEDFDPVWVR